MTQKIDINGTLREYRNDLKRKFPEPERAQTSNDLRMSIDRGASIRSSKDGPQKSPKKKVEKKKSPKIISDHNQSTIITESMDGG